MFDIFGKIDWSNNLKGDAIDPFKAVFFYDKIQSVRKYFCGDYYSILCLLKKDDTSVYAGENVQIFIYGYCFPKTGSSVKMDKKKLNAREVSRLYVEYGNRFIDYIKGSFSIIINDVKSKCLLIYTDPFNLRTIYYFQKDRQLFFSSSLNALNTIYKENGWKTGIDSFALAQYYLFDYTLNEDTFLKDIKTIPPGECLSYDENRFNFTQYWNVFRHYADMSVDCSEIEGAKRIEEIMLANIEMYKGSPDDTSVALTGGYDSRSIVSLLRDHIGEYEYYSYGKNPESWDLRVPRIIADKLKLRYKTYYLDNDFQRSFNENALATIVLSDGIAESSRSNYLYVYKNFFENKKNILTGLFGSELIKAPTSQGMFLDRNTRLLLGANNVQDVLNRIIDDGIENNMLMEHVLNNNRQKLHDMVASMPYFDASKAIQERYFYFLLMIGVRKYFMKEIKVERPFVTNYHPYFDIEFVDELMKTPFSWFYNWDEKKNLFKSLRTHRLYGYLIQRNNPKLANIITTHAYKPKYVMNNIYLPVLAIEYFYYKNKIDSVSGLNFDELNYQFADKYSGVIQKYSKFFNNTAIFEKKRDNMKDFNKLVSLQVWMHINEISV